MTVCEADRRIAGSAMASVIAALPGFDLAIYIVDDGSPSNVGRMLIEGFSPVPGHLVRFPRPLRFTGTARRLFAGLAAAAEGGFDAVVKFDPDTLVAPGDLAGLVAAAARERRGLSGVLVRMRRRDALLLVADLLPVGFRRRHRAGVIEKKWELRRVRPVWWWPMGWRAFRHGFRFRYIAGGMCIMGGDTLRELAARGWLARAQERRHGFTFADDLLISIAAAALGHPLSDPARVRPNWACLDGDHVTDWNARLAAGVLVLHPLKDNPRADAVRLAVERRRAEAARQGVAAE